MTKAPEMRFNRFVRADRGEIYGCVFKAFLGAFKDVLEVL